MDLLWAWRLFAGAEFGVRQVEYRLYFLRAGHIAQAAVLQCESDRDAIVAAGNHADGRAMELWEHARMVKAFAAESPLNPEWGRHRPTHPTS